jgi:Domain of Unknown Function with PDB structure (DUF3857)/Transglutaminase-like superfamily
MPARKRFPGHSSRRVGAATVAHERLYRSACSFYTALVIKRKSSRKPLLLLLYTAAACFLLIAGWPAASAQGPQQKPAPAPASKSTEKADKPEKPAHPAQIELLETKVRFEANGDSRKEVHALVRINSELGVRQFAQLNFDFNRSFETVEIPMVHITHASGGTADILPSAVTDRPNPAVVNFPAYQDVRVKSVRILGLQPRDTLEYRVLRTVSHHPLAPGFWLDHNFDRTGVVTMEVFEIDLPASLEPPATPPTLWSNEPHSYDKAVLFSGQPNPEPSLRKWTEGAEERVAYRWELSEPVKKLASRSAADTAAGMSDVELVFSPRAGGPTFWALSHQLYSLFVPSDPLPREITELAQQLTQGAATPDAQAERIYDFVSQKVKTIDLPLGATGFHLRAAAEIAASGYATQEDKVALFMALGSAAKIPARPVLLGPSQHLVAFVPRPSAFAHILVWCGLHFLDPSLEVAPFGMLPSSYRGSDALNVGEMSEAHDVPSLVMMRIPKDLPFPSSQKVQADAAVAGDGKLTANVHYAMRGDNELVLREAFHRTPKERWKEIAQLLSITDGFRGQVTSVNASDPYATKKPFSVEYELDQPKFVDWSKKPVRIPALLPQLGLPDSPAKPTSGSATAPIELGTPLEVETKMTLHLPPGTTASAPAGTSVERDYATYSSQYVVNGSTLTATRRIKFVLREVPAARAADYNAFLRAVRSDEVQDFTLEPSGSSAQKTNSAAPDGATPPKPVTPKP